MKNQKTRLSFLLVGVSLVAFSFLQTGCTSLQQSTSIAADDLYDIPAKKQATERVVARAEESNNEEYQDYQNYQDDRYLRLKVANRNRWSAIDDFGYWNDPRYNNAFYPSYTGWNSWYTGYYGASWYNPFGYTMNMGWGGYSPYMNSYYSMGWGFNDFGIGYGGFGYGGFGGYGYGGFGGYGYGWNPYYAGYWNPYGSYYGGGYGGGYGGIPNHYGNNYQSRRAMQTSAPALNSYRNNRSYNNSNSSYQVINGNTRYTGNPDLNNNFGNLMKRVITNNPNAGQANSFDRPARYFSNNNNSGSTNQYKTNSTPSNNNTTPSFNNNSGGRSGGFNSSGSSTGGGRAGRGGGRQ